MSQHLQETLSEINAQRQDFFLPKEKKGDYLKLLNIWQQRLSKSGSQISGMSITKRVGSELDVTLESVEDWSFSPSLHQLLFYLNQGLPKSEVLA